MLGTFLHYSLSQSLQKDDHCMFSEAVNQVTKFVILEVFSNLHNIELRQPHGSFCTPNLKLRLDPLISIQPQTSHAESACTGKKPNTRWLKYLNGSSTEDQLRWFPAESEIEPLFPTCHSNFHCSKWRKFHYCSFWWKVLQLTSLLRFSTAT